MGFGNPHFTRDVGKENMKQDAAKEEPAGQEARVVIEVAANGYIARCGSEHDPHVFETFAALTDFLRRRVPVHPIGRDVIHAQD